MDYSYNNYNNEEVRLNLKVGDNWDNLNIWFRAVEKNMPWVHKIFLITYTKEFSKWLNLPRKTQYSK